MNINLTQPEEIDIVIREERDLFVQSEFGSTQPLMSKSSNKKENDDEHYIPLYKTGFSIQQ